MPDRLTKAIDNQAVPKDFIKLPEGRFEEDEREALQMAIRSHASDKKTPEHKVRLLINVALKMGYVDLADEMNNMLK